MASGTDGLAWAAIAAGAVLTYSGVMGKGVLSALQTVVAGGSPSSAAAANQINTSTVPASSGTGTTGSSSSAAADALRYVGHCYSYGGSPGPDGTGCWDCSSFANWVLGHDLGLPIPGVAAGAYDGQDHGPTTLSYLAWSGCSTVGNSASDAEAGDLCVWQTHMGIATGAGNMVSALNEQDGTLETTISDAAPLGELLFVRRYNATT